MNNLGRGIQLRPAIAISLFLLTACTTPNPPPPRTIDLPLAVNNGTGSQYGNYVAQEAGEMRLPTGERCVIFNWDRPLTRDLAIRLRSASCESKERPGFMTCIELSRDVIPIAESNLANGQD
jgi:hypothetical protein